MRRAPSRPLRIPRGWRARSWRGLICGTISGNKGCGTISGLLAGGGKEPLRAFFLSRRKPRPVRGPPGRTNPAPTGFHTKSNRGMRVRECGQRFRQECRRIRKAFQVSGTNRECGHRSFLRVRNSPSPGTDRTAPKDTPRHLGPNTRQDSRFSFRKSSRILGEAPTIPCGALPVLRACQRTNPLRPRSRTARPVRPGADRGMLRRAFPVPPDRNAFQIVRAYGRIESLRRFVVQLSGLCVRGQGDLGTGRARRFIAGGGGVNAEC